MTNLRFVLTGGPGAGKTTILEALTAQGYQHVPDTARMIIKQRLEAGLSPRPALAQFGRDILERDITYYRQTVVANKPVFFDRGVVDALALVEMTEAMAPAQIEAHINEFLYNDLVFLTPPWPAIYTTDTQRDQTFAQSVQVFESARAWYERWAYRIVEIPWGDVERRVEFILKTVETALADD